MTMGGFARKYRLGSVVKESGHVGMAVLFATRLSDNLSVVIKSREKCRSFAGHSEESNWRHTMESLLNMPKSDTICELLEVVETEESFYVVMERINGKDLFDTAMEASLSHEEVRNIVRQILVSLVQLHGAGHIHKDLKMENVMIHQSPISSSNSIVSAGCSSQMFSSPSTVYASVNSNISTSSATSVKVIDFDTVEDWEPEKPAASIVLGTKGYIAPEAYNGNYSPASDIYCVGVIMYILLTGRLPLNMNIFDNKPGENFVGNPAMKWIYSCLRRQNIEFALPVFAECKEAARLCESLLAFEADMRPSAAQALEHPWFELSPQKL